MNRKLAIFAALLAMPVLAAATGESAAARVCKGPIIGTSSIASPTKGLAQANAEMRWGTKVTQTYSLQWSNWQNALDKKHLCQKKTTVIGANAWYCRAKAKPCIFQ